MLDPQCSALVLAPMDGVTDATMRSFQGVHGAFSYAVSEFLRVSVEPLPAKVFRRQVPELLSGGRATSGLPVQVQILGGDPDKMAQSALNACRAGALAIDINFGCPAPTVNRHDGGASLLRHPCRIREIVASVRLALPPQVPVSAKLRLGWENVDDIHENAEMAAQGGAAWLTIHARTRIQGYAPPVYWDRVGQVRRSLGIPVVANGDIWTVEDFLRCQDETGCRHFMIGRGALANPLLSFQISRELGLITSVPPEAAWSDWFQRFAAELNEAQLQRGYALVRTKQWMKIAYAQGCFPLFHELKQAHSFEELLGTLRKLEIADHLAHHADLALALARNPSV